ncbi:MAG TPA: plastocyanin/azurin family copper-binding protein [Acidimicrobiia bacterium]|nr:plastocyanin/azurin family copper-binding protein [Acidimicrobiia bacterium]
MSTLMTKQWTRRVGALLAAVAMTVGLAACGGGDDDGGGNAYVEPKGASTATIAVEAGNYYFEPDRISADAGIVTIKLTAKNGIHDFVFDGAYPGYRLEADGGGGAQSEKIGLKSGKYTFYCSITGHRAQGMEGTLTVK